MRLDGRKTWEAALSGLLDGATCLWQDLDGLHVEPPPATAPPTSVLWAWRGVCDLVRIRLDGQAVFAAMLRSDDATRVHGWSPEDGRVKSYRGPDAAGGGLGTGYEQVVVDGLDADVGPVTFIRPARARASRGEQP